MGESVGGRREGGSDGMSEGLGEGEVWSEG